MSFGDPMPEDDFDVCKQSDADACTLTYEQLYGELGACERENARLRMRVDALTAQLRLAKMPPTPSDISW